MWKFATGAIIVVLLASSALADFSGPVVSLLDGDTLEGLHKQHPERIRLSGIDCPTMRAN
jgi:micrococcal nuclease